LIFYKITFCNFPLSFSGKPTKPLSWKWLGIPTPVSWCRGGKTIAIDCGIATAGSCTHQRPATATSLHSPGHRTGSSSSWGRTTHSNSVTWMGWVQNCEGACDDFWRLIMMNLSSLRFIPEVKSYPVKNSRSVGVKRIRIYYVFRRLFPSYD
jgi:hypothetical protein